MCDPVSSGERTKAPLSPRRRVIRLTCLWIVVTIPLLVATLALVPWLVCVLLPASIGLGYWRLLSIRCPRCGERAFADSGGRLERLAHKCPSCGLDFH